MIYIYGDIAVRGAAIVRVRRVEAVLPSAAPGACEVVLHEHVEVLKVPVQAAEECSSKTASGSPPTDKSQKSKR